MVRARRLVTGMTVKRFNVELKESPRANAARRLTARLTGEAPRGVV
jgi:hypothetical protein